MRNIGVLFFLLLALPLWAEEAEKDETSSLTFSLSGGSSGSRGGMISTELSTSSPIRLNGGVGASSYNSGDAIERTSESLMAGFDYRINPDWEIGFGIDRWGLKDELVNTRLYMPIYFAFEPFSVLFRLGGGNVNFQSNTARAREFNFKEEFLGTRFSLAMTKYLRMVAVFEAHRFTAKDSRADISALSNDLASVFFSDSVLSLASSLIKRRTALSLSYAFTEFDLGVEAGRTVSAIDGAMAGYLEVFVDFDLNRQWLLGATVGGTRLKTDNAVEADPQGYMILSTTYRF